jgi:hypothetical protein
MFQGLILVCSLAITPSARDCSPTNALDVINGPGAPNDLACGKISQQYIAGTAIGRRLKPGEYVKTEFRRPTSIGKSNVG